MIADRQQELYLPARADYLLKLRRPSSVGARNVAKRKPSVGEVAILFAYLASPLVAAANGAAARCEGDILRARLKTKRVLTGNEAP